MRGAARPPRLCVVADSSFASLPMLVHDLLDEKVGSVLVDAAMGVVSRSVAYRAGFKISDVRVDAVAPVCPILLVHGSEDTFVLLKHSQKLQQAFKHTATLRVDDGGKHDSRRPGGNQPVCRVRSIGRILRELHDSRRDETAAATLISTRGDQMTSSSTARRFIDHLVGEAAAVPERGCADADAGLGRPPFASSTNFTSGADANRHHPPCGRRSRGASDHESQQTNAPAAI